MKVGIIGGGIAGLSAAYYIKKFALPVSQIVLFESSNRFGGWLNSTKVKDERNNREILFESGPRTLRYANSFKEMNTFALATNELKLSDEIDLVHGTHLAAKNRYIYLNGKIQILKPSFFFKTEIFGKPLISYILKEFRTPPRSADIKDESVYDFISRRVGTEIAENIIDPLLKGICGGDVRELSAASLLKTLYDGEIEHGGVLRAGFKNRKGKVNLDNQIIYKDLVELRNMPHLRGLNVWRFKNGIETFSNSLVSNLDKNGVELRAEEACLGIDFKSDSKKVAVRTVKDTYDFDFVISGLYSRDLSNLLSDEHAKLKSALNRIEAVNMVVINLYFEKNILPVQGFGYLVPTKENSPILGCIFDSVFDADASNHSTVTLMIGGASYKKYITEELENDHDKLLRFALDAFKKQVNFDVEPTKYKISIQRNCIPQYKVGHQEILKDINDYLDDKDLDDKLYLVGSSYNGFGINDLIFNSRNLCQKELTKKFNKE